MISLLALGEAAGFVAFALMGLAAVLMVWRAKLVRPVGGTDRLRSIHVAVALLALLFLAVHVGTMLSFTLTFPIAMGYGAVALGAVLWLTGVGFLERNRDSFFIHGSLAIAVAALVLAHASASGTNIPQTVGILALLTAGTVSLASAGYNMRKIRGRGR